MVTLVDDALGESLSAVMDGQATAADWARVNAAWANDPGLRERWALWHAAADGLSADELPQLHRQPAALLDALHAQLPSQRPAEKPARSRRLDWLAPLAVAAGFVAFAVGVTTLRPPPAPGAIFANAPISTPRAQGLGGLSFAQAASGRTLPADAPPEVIDWGLALPEAPAAPASQPRP